MINYFKLIVLFCIFLITSCKNKSDFVYNPQCDDGYYILTPDTASEPIIHGPSIFGVRPGSPFQYSIPATSDKPIEYGVKDLPEGLSIDTRTGLITGTIASLEEKEYIVTLVASNELGKATKEFKIQVGQEICLTPPLGWNSWNCWRREVSQDNVLASAKAMVDKGLKDYGWTYINIDDVWQGKRGGKYNAIQANPKTFPDMKQMCDEIHAMGLKVGIYSTPWITSYAGFIGGSSDYPDGRWDDSMGLLENKNRANNQRVGKNHFDIADAQQWAVWGIDYLKYDWNPNDPESTIRMAKALKESGRDIVYSLSNTAPIKYAKLYGQEVNCFRTAGDLEDRWDEEGSHLSIRDQWVLHRHWLEVGFEGAAGHFPDPDMLVVGNVTMHSNGGKLLPSRLTADEQYSHLSLWCLWSAPLLIGAPIESLDEFTMGLLTNTEVLNMHQDELGIPAKSVRREQGLEIFVKELADGSIAVGLFNLAENKQVITFDWYLAHLNGEMKVRDLWRQKDIGVFNDKFSAMVPSHGVVLIKVY